MPGQLFIASADKDFQRVLEDWSRDSGFSIQSPEVRDVTYDFTQIQDSDFVIFPVMEYSPDAYFSVYAGYALGIGKPLVVVLGSDTEELPPQFRSAFAVAVWEGFKRLLPMLKPLCGLSLLSEKIAEDIAMIQEEFGVK